MECRNSPVAKTPPSDLPDIPGVTSPSVEELKIENNHVQNCDEKVSTGECMQKNKCNAVLVPRNTQVYTWTGARTSLKAVVKALITTCKTKVCSMLLGN